MQLYYSTTSPFARKVNMLSYLCNLEGLERHAVNPMDSDALRKVNPLGKVPALVDGDLALFDSPLICEYLDDQHVAAGGQSLYHRNTNDYYLVAIAHAQANGILDAAVSTVMEQRRQDAEHSEFWLNRWATAIHKAIAHYPTAYLGNEEAPNIASVACIAALGYLDFRLPGTPWREWNPSLSDWYDTMKTLPWVTATAPKG